MQINKIEKTSKERKTLALEQQGMQLGFVSSLQLIKMKTSKYGT